MGDQIELRVHEDIRRAETLPSAVYSDPDLFERVRARIFARSSSG